MAAEKKTRSRNKTPGKHHSLEGFLPSKSLVMTRKLAGAQSKAALVKGEVLATAHLEKNDGQVLNTAPITDRDSFEQIAKDLEVATAGCARCKLCKQGRNTIVFGEGNPRADLVFVGEGPGEQEDLQGRPFVGRAGQLLTKMIEAMGLRREDVYICNVVKCRPPGNRNPEPDEIEACSPFLFRQLDLIRPKVVVALGKFAAQTLLKTEERISELRGNFFPYRGAKLIPTWHPSYLLRNPSAKKEAWDDLKKVAKELGMKIPSSKKTPDSSLSGAGGPSPAKF